jgi:multiple sugar transport system permease protein
MSTSATPSSPRGMVGPSAGPAKPSGRAPKTVRSKKYTGRVLFALSVFILVSPSLLFFLWMLSLSLKNEVDNMAYPPVFVPSAPTLDNFRDVFEKNDFLTYTWNSILVSFTATGLALLFGVPAGFGIAKTGAAKAAALVMIARVTPGLSYLIPLFLLFQWLGLTGTLTPIIITHLVITVPIVVWVMIGFFEGLPPSLEEAALVDGATIWQAFRYVALPLARPGITVATILSFIFSWNNFIFGVVLAGRETRTLPVAVYNVLTFEQISWGPLAAAALLVTAPVLLLTLLMQKEIVAGLTAGGVKGG